VGKLALLIDFRMGVYVSHWTMEGHEVATLLTRRVLQLLLSSKVD